MKNLSWRLLGYATLGVFVLYWIAISLCLLPSVPGRMMTTHAPRFKSLFGFSWKLFTPPYTYNNRLYYIIRETDNPAVADTLEVLRNSALQKRSHAPFNQPENILDHLLHNNTSRLMKVVWSSKIKPSPALPHTMDSAYLARILQEAQQKRYYDIYIQTLTNYGKLLFKQHHIPTQGKEMKMMVRQQPIVPFNHKNAPQQAQPEILVFETTYKPVPE